MAKKYTAEQRKAYWIGYGAGVTCDNPNELPQRLIDARLSRGQRKDLTDSAMAGVNAGKRDREVPAPFEKGFKRYPVTQKAFLADMRREEAEARKRYAADQASKKR